MKTILIQVSEEFVEEVEVERFVGCLAVHKTINGKGMTVTHIRSGIGLVNISPFTPYREIKHLVRRLAELFRYVLEPHGMGDVSKEKARKIKVAIDAINATNE